MYEDASQVANDAVSGIRTVASFCAEKKVMDMYQKKCEAPLTHGVRLGVVSGAGFGSSFLALYCINAFCFYIGAVLVKNGQATFGDVFRVQINLTLLVYGFFIIPILLVNFLSQVFFAASVSAIGISQSSALAPDSTKAMDSAASIFKILDSKPSIDSSRDEGLTLQTITGDIELQHVSFRYATRPNVEIFKDLCLSIPSGKVQKKTKSPFLSVKSLFR